MIEEELYEEMTTEQLRKRLIDAESTIAKIGLCSPAPNEARDRYERKYGNIDDRLESRIVRTKQ